MRVLGIDFADDFLVDRVLVFRFLTVAHLHYSEREALIS